LQIELAMNRPIAVVGAASSIGIKPYDDGGAAAAADGRFAVVLGGDCSIVLRASAGRLVALLERLLGAST
jgi:arginase family enzyme